MLIGAAVVLTGCNSDVEKTSMSMNGECVLMATATEADINLENYLTPVLQLAWQSPQWYSNDDTRNSTFNNLPAYIQTASEPGFGNIIESAANGQSMTYTAGNLNSFAKKLGMPIGKEGSLFFRIRCGNLETYSNVCEVKITPISVNMTRMAVLNQEKTDTISRLWSPSEDGIYTGMMKASAWMNCWFMEADGTVWGNTPVSESEFVLSNDDPWNCWFPDASGDYFVTVNTVKGWWSASHIETMTVNGKPMNYNKEDSRWETTIEPNGETTLSFEATAKLFDTESRTDAEKAKPQTYNFTVKGDTLVIGEKGNATFTGTGTHTVTISIDANGYYIYKVEAGNQTQQKPDVPKPLEMKIYDSNKTTVLATLNKVGDGLYSGELEVKWGWMNFFIADITDEEKPIFYGCPPSNDKASELSSASDCWNLWIPSELTGIYTIEANLNTMTWKATRTGDLPPSAPTELKVYENGTNVLGTLKKVSDGKYEGNITVSTAETTFKIVDNENSVWYGCSPSDATVLSAEEGNYNLWIDGGDTGTFTITADLNNMKWSYKKVSEGGTETTYPSELKIYGEPEWQAIATLTHTGNGAYSGVLTTTKSWMNFKVVDEGSSTWYGANDNTLSTDGGNLWTGEEVGDYTIEVNLSTMIWSATFKSE